jgi:hypothetical protein
MKGLSLTLEIVIIAIVLLVTALVIMTIFSGQMGNVMGILGIWSSDTMNQNYCRQQCAAWCQGNPGKPSTGWAEHDATWTSNSKTCSSIMNGLGDCTCTVVGNTK